jgi:hypothetical protein
MAATAPVTLRCPRCAGFLSAHPPPGSGVYWAHCPNCQYPVPVIHPRDPAPLFAWEVYPNLAPVGRLPTFSGPRAQRFSGLLLLVAAAVLILLGGLSLSAGVGALPSHTYTVAGTVTGSAVNGTPPGPLAGAIVVVTGEQGFHASTATNGNGSFAIPGVPSGAITLNVTAPGFAPVEEELFDSPVYSAPASGSGHLTIQLNHGTVGEGTYLAVSEFPNLETLLASLLSGALLFTLVAGIAAVGALKDLNRDRPAWSVAGGAAAGLAALLLPDLGTVSVVPLGEATSLLAGLLGTLVFVVASARLAARSPPIGPTERGL